MAKKIVETPLMRQYVEMKGKHPDAILLSVSATSMRHFPTMQSLHPRFWYYADATSQR